MALESGSYLADLNTANPVGTDPKSQGDDHLRLVKSVLKNSFAGFPGAVVVTGAETQGPTANDYVVTVSPAPAAYSASTIVLLKATHANTGAATLKFNALAAKALKAVDGGALEAGDIENGALCAAFYDGTDFLLVSGNDRAARGGDSYTGAHDFTGATARVATQGAADNSTKAASTAYVDAADALKADLSGATYTGAHDFTAGDAHVATAAAGTNDTTAASTAFATQLAFQTALPVQAGAGGKFLQTDGAAASWVGPFVGDSGAGGLTGVVPAPAAGDASKFLKGSGVWALSPSCPDVVVQEQKSSGVSSAVYIGGAWRTRELNTIVRNNGSLGALESSQLTLAAGTWLLRARAAMAFQAGSGSLTAVGRARLFNATDATSMAQGENVQYAYDDEHGFTTGAVAEVSAVVVLGASKAIALQTRQSNGSSVALPLSAGDVEVYATIEATRLS